MDVTDARRQVAEINALRSQPRYRHAIEITTPALFRRLETTVGHGRDRTLPVKKRLALRVHCRELDLSDAWSGAVLEIDLPLAYPSGATCAVRVLDYKIGGPVGGASAALATYLDSFLGCECLELVLEWLSENKNSCFLSGDPASNDTGKVECYVLRFNHLLAGSEHKKEKAMVGVAKKSKLQGGLLWGTPGIVVVVPPSTEEDARDYAAASREAGKRPDGVEGVRLPATGVEEAGLGGLAQEERGGRLQNMTTATLRTACGGDEDLLRSVLGIK